MHNDGSIRAAWKHSRHVLVIQQHGLAHYLAITPALATLAEALPRTRLTLLTTASVAPAARLHPALSAVWVFDPFLPIAEGAASLAGDAEHGVPAIDGAMIFAPAETRAAAVEHTATELRTALSLTRIAALGTTPVGGVSTLVAPNSRSQHEVARALDLVAGLGCQPDESDLMLEIPMEASAVLFDRLTTMHVLQDQPVIVIAPRAERSYPTAQWITSLRQITQRQAATLVVDGTPAGTRLAGAMPAVLRNQVIVMPATSPFADRAALLESADVVVTDDVAIAQLAAAVKSSVVWLNDHTWQSTHLFPWRVPYVELVHPDFCTRCDTQRHPFGEHCPNAVQPSHIVTAVHTLLNESSRPLDLPAAQHDESLLSAAGFAGVL